METTGHFITAEVYVNSQWTTEEAKEAIEAFCLAMRQEAGCTLAQAWQDNADPRRFILWERYKDLAAHQQHFALPHTQAFIAAGWVKLICAFETTLADDKNQENNL